MDNDQMLTMMEQPQEQRAVFSREHFTQEHLGQFGPSKKAMRRNKQAKPDLIEKIMSDLFGK